ncbi:hypothetical protein [Pseudomonas sp. PDM25]|uniref:hypothetical protein n=1 Tax=Pseudomonas sp. PDM25 TaxID=2854772 RepID=UPI001C443654|nr:hypothetical protein [Pseudomonas sp. PDM25]
MLTGQLSHASDSDYGTARSGTGITSNNGVFSVDTVAVADSLPRADGNIFGTVRVGYGLDTHDGGSLCLKYATTYSIGGVQLATPEAVRSGDDNLAAVTPLGLKAAYLPKLNPEVDGAVTITKDQTKYPPADQELVTSKLLNQSIQGITTDPIGSALL